MKEDSLKYLRCPLCAKALRVAQVLEYDRSSILHGRVRCACNEYPILQGILILGEGRCGAYWKNQVSDCIKKEDRSGTEMCLDFSLSRDPVCVMRLLNKLLPSKLVHSRGLGRVLAWIGRRGLGAPFRRLLAEGAKYSDIDKALCFSYLFHRFSFDSFWPTYTMIPLMGWQPEIVVDVGCGGGHASFLISQLVNPQVHFCLDRDFRFLLLTKHFCAPDAQCILYDLNFPMPFEDRSINGVFTLDVLHYVYQHRLVTKELQRIVDDHGVLLALHLHNALVKHPAVGHHPLPARLWIEMFDQVKPRAFPDSRLIEDFLAKRPIDLGRHYTSRDLDEADAISIVAARTNDILDQLKPMVPNPWAIRGRLVVNPLYKINDAGDQVILRRKFPHKRFRDEFRFTEHILPEVYTLEASFRECLDGVDASTIASLPEGERQRWEVLLDRFILLLVPDQYV